MKLIELQEFIRFPNRVHIGHGDDEDDEDDDDDDDDDEPGDTVLHLA